MRRTGTVALMASAVLAAGVVTGGVVAVGQELDVDNDPGAPLTIQGVETGAAAQDETASLIGSRIRAESGAPKVDPAKAKAKSKTVVEVAPSGPVVIRPHADRPAKKPWPRKDHHSWWKHDDHRPGDDDRRGDDRGPGGPGDHSGPGGGGPGGH